MNTVILACQTVFDELNMVIEETGVSHPVYWIESGLHNTTGKLHKKIQEELENLQESETVLLAFGYCGNALQGIGSDYSRLVMPRIDDCISMLLGSAQERQKRDKEQTTYFFTAGWLKYERSLVQEYEYARKKYGQERALELMKMMLKHYERFALIDTGAYDLTPHLDEIKKLSSVLEMDQQVIKGSLRIFRKLLTGPWDEEFIIVPPGEKIALDYGVLSQNESVLQGD